MTYLFISLITFLTSILPGPKNTNGVMPMLISSNSFVNNGDIPVKYTCQGENINPNLIIEEYPPKTKSLVVIMDDPDAPDKPFDHWILYNIMPTKMINEKSAPGLEGKNSKGTIGYTGPCPPTGKHHYHFQVYALDMMISVKAGAPRSSVERGMLNHIIGYGEMTGLYQKTAASTGKQ
jgi:Raf kinase inhibitor-like YbhB/YbcL family protein